MHSPLILLIAAAQVQAAEPSLNPPFAAPLREIEVHTPTRGPSNPQRLPFSVERVPETRLRNEQMAATLPEALLEIPGVLVQQTSHGQGSPFLRGFTGFRTLMLVDGIRLNNSTFREGPNQYWSTVDALAVERLEVVKGPSSVLYGSDAIGGTVNALMRTPRYGFDDRTTWSGAAYYRFASAERSHAGRGEAGAAQLEDWGFTLGYSAKTFGDVEGGEEVGRQPHTGYDQWDIDAKIDYFFQPKIKLTVAWQRTEQNDVERTHRTIYGVSWEGLTRGTDLQHWFDQERELTYARLAIETDRADRIQATVSWHRQDEFQFVERANNTVQQSETEVDTLGVTVQAESPSPIGIWTYGVEYYRDFIDSGTENYSAAGALTSTAIQGPVADNSSYDLLGVFVQDDIAFGPQWRLILGGRYTHAAADAGRVRDPITALPTSYEQDWNHGVGSGRLLWNPDGENRLAVFGGISQGFRAPNLSDVTRFDIARSGELETAAFDLKPEKFISFETGVKVAEARWSGSLAYYYTIIDDLIVRTPTGTIVNGNLEVTKRNASEGWVHGAELSGKVYLGEGFSFYGSLAWQEGEADAYPTSGSESIRAPMSRMHPLVGIPGLRWDSLSLQWPVFAEIFGVIAAEQDRLSPDDQRDTQRIPPGGTPGFATLNFRVGYDWRGKLRAVAALENVLDEDYRIHGSGYNQPGRNAKLSVEYRF